MNFKLCKDIKDVFFCQWSSNCNCYYYVSGWEVSGDLRVTCCIAFDWYSDPRYPDLIQSEAIVSGRKRIKVLCLHDFLYFSKRWITLLCILSGYMLQTKQKLGIEILSELEEWYWGLFIPQWCWTTSIADTEILITFLNQDKSWLKQCHGKALYSAIKKIFISQSCLVPK